MCSSINISTTKQACKPQTYASLKLNLPTQSVDLFAKLQIVMKKERQWWKSLVKFQDITNPRPKVPKAPTGALDFLNVLFFVWLHLNFKRSVVVAGKLLKLWHKDLMEARSGKNYQIGEQVWFCYTISCAKTFPLGTLSFKTNGKMSDTLDWCKKLNKANFSTTKNMDFIMIFSFQRLLQKCTYYQTLPDLQQTKKVSCSQLGPLEYTFDYAKTDFLGC